MRFAPATRRLTMWIALLALLMAALAPSVSAALAAERGVGWLEICSAAERKAPGEVPDGAGTHLFEHCPYCSVHFPAPALPPAPQAFVPAAEAVRDWPAAFLSAPRTLHAWSAAQPRAPPFLA